MALNNSLGFDGFNVKLLDTGMSREQFTKKYPEGKYLIALIPSKYGHLEVNIIHEFPDPPDITSPADGATDVSTKATVTWNPLSSIDGLTLYLKGKDLDEEEFKLPTDATSYDFSSSPLQPNTEYELRLESINTDGKGNDMRTQRIINFTTGAE